MSIGLAPIENARVILNASEATMLRACVGALVDREDLDHEGPR